MSKIRALVSIDSPEGNQAYEVDAILQDSNLKYKENKETKVMFSYLNNNLVRENDELRMEYLFLENKTTKGNIFIKELNKKINVDIKTKSIKRKSNDIEIVFNVENNKFIYRVEVIK
jgi:hypothetical protein